MTVTRADLVLVRHARPVIDPDQPAGTWLLDAGAAGDVRRLATGLGHLGIDGIVSSPEPKAEATGRELGEVLGLPVVTDQRLREQGHGVVPWYEPEAFQRAVGAHFRSADEVLLGAESATDAARRIGAAVDAARAMYRCPALVTHGRVMSAWCAGACGVDPVRFWEQLRMPDAWAVSLDDRRCWRVDEGGSA